MKRFRWLLLVAAVCVPLAACGGTSSSDVVERPPRS